MSLPKIVEKMKRKISGSSTVKKTEAGLRQKIFWSKRNWCGRARRRSRVLRRLPGQLEVDVLEARPADLEPASSSARSSAQPVSRFSTPTGRRGREPSSPSEPASPRRRAGARRRRPRRAAGTLIWPAGCSRSPSSSGRPSATMRPAGDDRRPVGEPLRLVHVVRGEEDSSCRGRAGRRSPPRPDGGPRGRTRWSARRGRAGPDRRSGRRRRRGGAAGRRRGCPPGRPPSRRARPARSSRRRRAAAVVAGEQLERLAHRELGTHPALLQDDPDPLPPSRVGARVLAEHRRPRPRCARDSPRGSPPWSSCPRRWGRGTRRPRPVHLEVDPADRLGVAVGLAQARGLITGSRRHRCGILGSCPGSPRRR